ncbi:MAG: penicillin acylase family protein [Burkholderiales bacterium]
MKTIVRLALAILLLGIVALGGAVFYLRLSLPQTSGTIVVPDVRGTVEIVRDRHGIPHIFAQNSADANFALGFAHAQDRLWQMEINRRIAAGRMAEIVGKRALASDKFLRTLGITRQAAATFEHLDNEARSALSAYAAGVNAYLQQRSGPLPPEFVLLGVKPELWTAVDSLSWVKMMAWDLSGNWRQELLRARLAEKLFAQQIEEFLTPRRDQAGTWKAQSPAKRVPESGAAQPDSVPGQTQNGPKPPHSEPQKPQTQPEALAPPLLESDRSEPQSVPSESAQPESAQPESAQPQPEPGQLAPEPASEKPTPEPSAEKSTPEQEEAAPESESAAPAQPSERLEPTEPQPEAAPGEPEQAAPGEPEQTPPGEPEQAPAAPGPSASESFGDEPAPPQPSDADPEKPATAPNETRFEPEPALNRVAPNLSMPSPSVAPDLRALYVNLSDEFAHLAALAPPGLPDGAGSNNWAIAGRFSASGKPLLANDPHLSLTAPSVWYFAHLHTPQINVIGATFPGVPSVVLGRNDRIAWAFTNTGPDVQDLFLEKIDARDPGRYQTPDGTRAFEVRTETIKVKNWPDVVLTIRESRHGPIISDVIDAPVEAGHALAFAWAALADDDLSFQASLKLARAGDWDEFVAAMRDFHSPQQNVVYADVAGNIGFIAPGRVPMRKPGNDLQGLSPAPGWDARYDWDGYIPFDELPRSFNPAEGKIVTANNRIVADDYPHLLAYDWAAPYRARRIAELLDASARHTPATFAAIQGDITSPMIAEFLPLLLKAPALTAEAAAALQLLDDWDGEMLADQPRPLIAAAWLRELSRLVYADELGELFDDAWEQRPLFLFNVLTDQDGQGRWCDDITTTAREDCAQQTGAALNLALADLRQRYGVNMLRWRWGDAHVAEAEHRPFSRDALFGRLFDLRTPTAGDTHSINVGSYKIRDARAPYASRHAATLRAIYDLADLDGSLFIHETGQSGNRLSPRYADFVARWAAVEYLPMTTRRSEIDDGAIGTLRLQPAP